MRSKSLGRRVSEALCGLAALDGITDKQMLGSSLQDFNPEQQPSIVEPERAHPELLAKSALGDRMAQAEIDEAIASMPVNPADRRNG
jgi:hypothetical protein